MITVPDIDCGGEAFHGLLLDTFPKLRDAGGFELLRCKPNTRELEVIAPRISSNPRLLKRSVANSRIYIRPIQRDLSLAGVDDTEEEVDMVISIIIT